jgi:hypothetical protein
MTTTISASVGAGIAFTQQGQGTTPGYSALDLRRSDSLGLQEGVLNASDFMVVQRGAGATMSVDIGMPAGGFACVQGDTIAGQGLYTVPVHSATINEAIAAADATNPRVDQVILEILDNVHDGTGGNRAQTRVLTGTATVGATLTNRTGAVALPANACLLADVLVGAAAASITNTVIRDRRKWARGAHVFIVRNTGNYTTVSGSYVEVDTTNLKPRVECSGAPVRIKMSSYAAISAVTTAFFNYFLDGVSASQARGIQETVAGANQPTTFEWETTPAAGSHQFSLAFLTTSGTLTLAATAADQLLFSVEEVVRQNTANNSTTSG